LINYKQRKLKNYTNSLRHSFRKKTTLTNISSNSFISTEKDIISILKNSKNIHRAKPVIENIDDFEEKK
jgi:hypothetical protein